MFDRYGDLMPSRRCSNCGACWPNQVGRDGYAYCPECVEPTYVSSKNEPMDAAEAHSRKCHARFERWLDEHDRRDPVELLDAIPVKEKT